MVGALAFHPKRPTTGAPRRRSHTRFGRPEMPSPSASSGRRGEQRRVVDRGDQAEAEDRLADAHRRERVGRERAVARSSIERAARAGCTARRRRTSRDAPRTRGGCAFGRDAEDGAIAELPAVVRLGDAARSRVARRER
jgi:hypothetical protein